MKRPDKILMCRPEYFEVNYTGNVFMESNKGNVDKNLALKQWAELGAIYKKLDLEVLNIEPGAGMVDMVFTANQSFPFIDEDENKKVILSKMRNSERQGEVGYFKEFYHSFGYEILELPKAVNYFESMGDAIIDYERKIIFGGYGARTGKEVYGYIANHTKCKVVTLELANQSLYHLDTCFSILNKDTAVIDISGFNKKGLEDIRKYFPLVIEADIEENMKYFVCNCHCPDGRNVIVQQGSDKFKSDIKNAGFNVIETDTGEFLKSGGSVFCMKLMMY